MRCLVLSLAIAFVLLIGVFALAQAQGPDEPVLAYQVAVPDANQERIVITGTITGLNAPSLTLARPSLSLLPDIENLVVVDGSGTPLSYNLSVDDPDSGGHQRYTISNTVGIHSVRFSYVVSMANGIAWRDGVLSGYWHFEPGEYTLIESQRIFLQPVSAALTALTMTFGLPPGWIPLSRLLAKGGYYQAIVTDTVNYGDQEETYYLFGPSALVNSMSTRTPPGALSSLLPCLRKTRCWDQISQLRALRPTVTSANIFGLWVMG